jgi:tripartite-type tricarboxylate transporter receptor subunit TctC
MSLLHRRRLLCAGVGAASLAGLGKSAFTQEAHWPSRPLRLIVVYPPGGVSDLMARSLA